MTQRIILLPVTLLLVAIGGAAFVAAADEVSASPRIKLVQDDAKGELRVLLDGKEAIVYCCDARTQPCRRTTDTGSR
jgi:hypothetical protein